MVKNDDGTYAPLCHISEAELTTETDEDTRYLGDTAEFTGTFSTEMDEKDILRLLLPRGMANARILKRDGYLSPENGVMG